MSKSSAMQGDRAQGAGFSAIGHVSEQRYKSWRKSCRIEVLESRPALTPAKHANTKSALDNYDEAEDKIAVLLLDGNISMWCWVVESRKARGGSRHIVNVCTTKSPFYRTYPGLHFDKGLGDTSLDQSECRAANLGDKRCSDMKTFH